MWTLAMINSQELLCIKVKYYWVNDLDDSPAELAEAFWKEHNLHKSKQIKLEKIIISHLNNALDRIEEEPEEA